jgi:Protein of unknown function (DUF732)
MRFTMVLVSVAATITMAAPAYADPDTDSNTSADADFLNQLKQAGLTYQDPAKAISAAKTVCQLVDDGTPDTEIVNNLQLRNGFTGNGAAKFTSIAAAAYCPKYLTGEGRGPKPEGAKGN